MPPPADPTKSCDHRFASGCALAVGFFILIFIGVALSGGAGSSEPTGTSASPTSQPAQSDDFDVGSKFAVYSPDGSPVPAFQTLDDEKVAVDASVSKDTIGIANLMSEGRLVRLSSGTSVLVIALAPGFFNADLVYTRRVRVLDGPLTGGAYWVETRWLR